PQDAAAYLGQQPHPDLEKFRRDLVIVVEAAEDKTPIRQPRFGPHRHARYDLPLAVIALIGVRQICDLLGVETAVLGGDDRAIGDDIVYVIDAHRTREAEMMGLYRRDTVAQQ